MSEGNCKALREAYRKAAIVEVKNDGVLWTRK